MNNIMERIQRLGQKQLENLLENAQRVISEGADPARVRAAKEIAEACDRELMKFRPKANFQHQVEDVMEEIAVRHGLMKLPSSVVGSGVLPGGAMRAGWYTAEFYVGFRCPPWKRSAVFAALMREKGDPMEFWVYDFDYPTPKAPPENWVRPEWMHKEWDLGIPCLRTVDAEEAAAKFKEIIAPYVKIEQQDTSHGPVRPMDLNVQ